MRSLVGAFRLAERMLGDLQLSVGQWTRLRAIDHKYQQSLFTLLDGATRAPTSDEIQKLDEVAARDILDMLTLDQRVQISTGLRVKEH